MRSRIQRRSDMCSLGVGLSRRSIQVLTEPSQRAEGLATCWLAGAAVKAWADQGNGAERGAEQKAAAALKGPTTLLAVSMPRQKPRRRGRNEAYLRPGQHGLRLLKRQADLLEVV